MGNHSEHRRRKKCSCNCRGEEGGHHRSSHRHGKSSHTHHQSEKQVDSRKKQVHHSYHTHYNYDHHGGHQSLADLERAAEERVMSGYHYHSRHSASNNTVSYFRNSNHGGGLSSSQATVLLEEELNAARRKEQVLQAQIDQLKKIEDKGAELQKSQEKIIAENEELKRKLNYYSVTRLVADLRREALDSLHDVDAIKKALDN